MVNKIERKQWNSAIDYIKAIAMLFVVITHYSWTSEQRLLFGFPFWIDLAIPTLMIVTGYNYYNSAKKGFGCKKIVQYISRLLIPFAFVAIFECIIQLVLFRQPWKNVAIATIFEGGYGPGAYYVPVMIQIIVFFPLLYHIVFKYKYGWVYMVGLNVIFELFVAIVNFNDGLYRLCALRYITFITIGALIAKWSKVKLKKRGDYILLFLIGVTAIVLLNYFDYNGALFRRWKTTSIPCIFLSSFYFFIAQIFLQKYNRFVCIIGKASFHIFLIQKIYYGYVIPLIKNYISFGYLAIPLNILICFIVGVAFFQLECVIKNRKEH